MSLITILKEYFPIIGEVPLTGTFKVLMKQQDYVLCGSYFVLQILRTAGVQVKLQQPVQNIAEGHGLGVLRGVAADLPDGPGGGGPDVMLGLLRQTQGQLGHPLQERRTHYTLGRNQAGETHTCNTHTRTLDRMSAMARFSL